jgi:glycosyltransferase involved in cell wall biosynthesis
VGDRQGAEETIAGAGERASESPRSTPKGVSVVVPAYDEEEAIEKTIAEVRAAMKAWPADHELIVVDDGSRDRTAALAEAAGATVLRHPVNRGYGAALKTGIRAASHEIIVITDADGTYPAREIPALLEWVDDYDMVVGARTGENVNVPVMRRPAKWLLRKLASFLAGREIPDLNSGLRVLRRRDVERFEHLLPSGFSFTTTITLASLCTDLLVHYHPIDYLDRVGESKIRSAHALEFLILIVRIIVYFNPLKVFLPLGAVFFGSGLLKFGYDLVIGNLSEMALLGFLGGIIIWSLGLLSDQIARVGLGKGRS